MVSKSKYTWKQITKHGNQIIIIEDQDEGMTVTNNVENVLREIAHERQQPLLHEIIIYLDTEKDWDGIEINPSSGTFSQFYPLRTKDEEQAIENALLYHDVTK